MKPQFKKNIFRSVLALAAIVLIVFLPKLKSANLKSYLSASDTLGSYATEIVWGQAYSANAGWINFYCDGAGNTQPPDISVNYPDRGAATMDDACGSVAYQTEYDPNSETFSGAAYSSNFGWLDMEGVAMNVPGEITDIVELTGSSDGGALGTLYNFGTTYFADNQPNAFNPGVRYYSEEAYLCGFAYSDTIGYISFCDPQTKEIAPENISVPGFNWDTYAVYLGIAESGDEGEPGAPTLTTPSQVLAATDDYSYPLWFMDDASGIDSVVVEIPDSNGDIQTYTADYFDPATKRARVEITGHDFHKAAKYNLQYTACDNVGNCATDYLLPNFFQVVANVPVPTFTNPVTSYFEFSTGATPIADGIENHFVKLVLRDEYDNPVIPVAGIKSVGAEFVFVNTTKLNQITGTGEAAVFTASEFGLDQSGGTSTGFLEETTSGDGKFEVEITSFAPTSAGYPPIASDSIDLDFAELNLKIEALGGYTNVGASSATVATPHAFDFAPTLAATPTALIWNAATNLFEVDPDGVRNITVNAAKRFNLDLQNQSSNVDISAPKIGIALDSGAASNIEWTDGTIETAGSATDLDQNLNLDTDTNTQFDGIWQNLDSWITTIATNNVDRSLRFSATPTLTSDSSSADSNTILQSYICYSFSGKEICHRGAKLGDDAAASLYNPSIEIIGSVHSAGGTASKQTGAALNQSLGSLVQNEFENIINRNLAPILTNSGDACTASTTITSAADLESLDCKFANGTVIYFKNADVALDFVDEKLPLAPRTIVVEGGNLSIKSNLKYQSSSSSLGIIVLKNDLDAGGNIFIDADVTNLVGAAYTEGGVISVNSQGKFGEDDSSSCTGADGFCDRSYELRNQLYWKGLLATGNTIGGADKTTYECPGFVTVCDRATARIYDFAYLRTYHVNSGGTAASNSPSDASFVLEYDARVPNNTPPLFDTITESTEEEI